MLGQDVRVRLWGMGDKARKTSLLYKYRCAYAFCFSMVSWNKASSNFQPDS